MRAGHIHLAGIGTWRPATAHIRPPGAFARPGAAPTAGPGSTSGSWTATGHDSAARSSQAARHDTTARPKTDHDDSAACPKAEPGDAAARPDVQPADTAARSQADGDDTTARPGAEAAVHAARTALTRAGLPYERFGALLHGSTLPAGPAHLSVPHYVLHRTLGRAVTAAELRQGQLSLLSALGLCAHLLRAPGGKDAVLITGSDPAAPAPETRGDLGVRDDPHASATAPAAPTGHALVVSRLGGFARVLSVAENCDPGHYDLRIPPGTGWAALRTRTEDQVLAEAGVARGDLAATLTGASGAGDLVPALEELCATGRAAPGDRLLLTAATPGLEAGAAVLEITAALP
ncbi:hypothetical protein ACWEWI_04740 [Streptomyces sp. NPDC003753]|uniref:hypothetical protein n=1 Tax=Streptomyces sp. Y2F8-2 TaxID=2759675 RepID=UPI001906F03A|nr:hypothetical protein [Streptomyces sp. Y2F8-2]GHJ98968.1 hypothetical protein SY2F82_07660 [Streptomyces sp. Y2F8-2]